MGLLHIANPEEGREFGAEDLFFLEAVGRQAMVGVQNARLYEAEHDQRQQLERARERLNALVAQVLSAQEGERRRVAMELHDGPAQTLAALLWDLEVCRRLVGELPQGAGAQWEHLEVNLRAAITDLRVLIKDLRPPSLDDMGLAPCLRQHLREVGEEAGMEAEMVIGGDPVPLDPATAAVIYRIVQEALTNAKKHASADRAVLTLHFSPEGLRIRLEDNGKGFSPGAAEGPGLHFGLLGMRERAEMLGGELQVASAPGQGTVITLTVPASALEPKGAARAKGDG